MIAAWAQVVGEQEAATFAVDPGVGAIIAAAAALTVGFGAAVLSRRTALDVQRGSEQAKALVRVLQVAELNGQGIHDLIFNLTMARDPRAGERDLVTGEVNDPYAPHPRAIRKLDGQEIAEAQALLAAYGTTELDANFAAWRASTQALERAYLRSEVRYSEERVSPLHEHFAAELAAEQTARIELGAATRRVLQRSRRRRG